MRAVVKSALAIVLVVGVGITGVDLPDRAGPRCQRCCDIDDAGDLGAAMPALVPAVCVDVGPQRVVQLDEQPPPATPDRAPEVLIAAPKTSPPNLTA